jgi:hypothetical protein
MLVNWDAEKIIWDRLFSKDVLDVGHLMDRVITTTLT